MHACDLAARLGIETVLIPPRAGVAAAFGMIVAPITYGAVRSRRTLLSTLSADGLAEIYRDMRAECTQRLPRTVAPADVTFECSVDMRYLGQGYDVTATFPERGDHEATIAAMRAAFERTYQKLYGRIFTDLPLEIMNFRMTASASRRVPVVAGTDAAASGDGKIGTRRAYCPKLRAWTEFHVHRRMAIAPDVSFPGPAIVEENESTTVIPSGARAHVDAHGSLIVKLAA